MKSFIRAYMLHLFIFLLIGISFFLVSCREKSDYMRDEGLIWNTVYHTCYKSDKNLNDSLLIVLDRIGKSLSIFDTHSLINKVNSSDTVIVDEFFIKVYNKAKDIGQRSQDMFDPTVSPLITAWGFGPGHKIDIDQQAIDSLLQFVGITKTHLNGDTLIKEDIRTQFNFSAIAKGFGCDLAGEMLGRNGVKDYMVEIGGEIALSGKSPSGGLWRISIDAPIEDESNIIHDSFSVIELTDCGIATSGNYRNYHKTETEKFGHTISPVTGYPVQTEIISATVVAPSAMEADAVATACMASGLENSKRLLKELSFEGLLILSDSTTWMTEGFRELISVKVSEPERKDRN